jgi:hypothetical protein
MRLIDCHTGDIVKAEPSSPWVALSYVWGPPDLPTQPSQDLSDKAEHLIRTQEFAETSEQREFPEHSEICTVKMPPQVPATVKDAMEVTLGLGYRYLWCDAYCIDQGNGPHKADQISKMDKIYQGAEVTIIATGPDKHHGLHGVSAPRESSYETVQVRGRNIFFTGPDPLDELHSSAWKERAWTFQEGYLSKRLLVFTEHQTAFYCASASWMEALGGPEHVKEPRGFEWPIIWPFSEYGFQYSFSADRTRWHDFVQLARLYNDRSLTHDTDSLNAFYGVVNFLREKEPHLLHLKGLPYVSLVNYSGYAEGDSAYIFCALSWYHWTNKTHRRRKDFPCTFFDVRISYHT